MRLRNLHRIIAVIVVAAAAAPFAAGCEILSSVDRSDVAVVAECAAATECNDTPNDCLSPACSEGLCADTPVPAGSACSVDDGKVCNDAGACVACNAASDCEDMTSDCKVPACADGVCGEADEPADTICKESPGMFCDGAGTCVECNDSSQCGNPPGDCKVPTCSMNKCGDASEAKGTACNADGGKVCDAAGACVECNVDAECATGVCKMDGACAPPSCGDSVLNGSESDVDCGGIDCDGCADAKKCTAGSDCASKVCTSSICQPATCTDNIENGSETDVDCGGSCPNNCADTKGCSVGADCVSGVCSGMVCQAPACNDLAKNGSETDVDCGGSCPNKCAAGKGCSIVSDCVSAVCVAMVCQP